MAKQRRDADDRRGVVAREAGDEVLGLGLLLGCVLHELEDAAHGGLAEGLGHAHGDEAAHVDAARDDLVALAHLARHRLAGEGRGVQLRGAAHHHAVERHALAGFDDDLVAHGHLVGVDLHEPPVALHVGEIGRDVHHVGDRLARFAHGVALEQLAHLVEQHDGRAFGHVRVAVGEQHQRERADGGHAHEEVLVEHLAVADVLRRAQKHVVAGDEVGDEEERELHPERGCLASEPRGERHELGDHVDDGEQRDGEDDAVPRSFLFLVHRFQLSVRSRARNAAGVFHVKHPFVKSAASALVRRRPLDGRWVNAG